MSPALFRPLPDATMGSDCSRAHFGCSRRLLLGRSLASLLTRRRLVAQAEPVVSHTPGFPLARAVRAGRMLMVNSGSMLSRCHHRVHGLGASAACNGRRAAPRLADLSRSIMGSRQVLCAAARPVATSFTSGRQENVAALSDLPYVCMIQMITRDEARLSPANMHRN